MRSLLLVIALIIPALASAQPAGSGSAETGSGSAAPASQPAAPPPPAPSPPSSSSPGTDAAALRKVCADAMNADPTFAQAIVETINADTAKQHRDAAMAIAKNEKHVLFAYGAMWAVAAAFLIFMWRRQQGLKSEIAQLKRDLEAAAK